MKSIFLSLSMLFLTCAVYSQSIIENPVIGLKTTADLQLIKVELGDTATILSFHAAHDPNKPLTISRETYIQLPGSKDKLTIRSAKGIVIGEPVKVPASGEMDYQLIFPKLDPTTSKIDYGEKDLQMMDIFLKTFADRPIVKAIKGNWYNKQTGDWELSFCDTVAVYKNKVWQMSAQKFNNGEGSVSLKNNKNKITLFIKRGSEGNCWIGESLKSMKEYSSNISGIKLKADDAPFQLPVFKNDSAVFAGYINGYIPRMGVKTATVYVQDILTGEQNPYLMTISEDGTFRIKIPLYYPHIILVRSNMMGTSAFLEPGKELFTMIDLNYRPADQLYMGECGRINADLHRMEKLISFNYFEMQKKILELKPTEYKKWLVDLKQKDLEAFDLFSKGHVLSAKALQVKKLEIEYSYIVHLLSYAMDFEQAYRSKNKIPATQRTLSVKPEVLKSEYYDFINEEVVNNPIAVVTDEYSSFINRLKYVEIFRNPAINYSTLDIIAAFESSGAKQNEEEQSLIKAIKEGNFQTTDSEKEFQTKYSQKNTQFFRKYQNYFEELSKNNKQGPITIAAIENFLMEKGVSFTSEETELIAAMKSLDKDENVIRKREFMEKYKNPIQNFIKEHQSYMGDFIKSRTRIARDEYLEKMFHVKKGFASDIMLSQDIASPIVSQMTPVAEKIIQNTKQQISTPFIAEYLAYCNQITSAKIKANKIKAGSSGKEVPKTAADKLFDELMKSYKGKVVLVDFWATWCAPCRAGIERIKPLKEEMSGKNVVFVYITGPSSPLETYNNMIPDIKGEHFRVSNDEWNYLCNKFKVTGIPHQMIVNKKGEVVNSHLELSMNNETLKKELEKQMKEL